MAELTSTCLRCGAFVDTGPHCQPCSERVALDAWDAQTRVRARRSTVAWWIVAVVVGVPVLLMIADAVLVGIIKAGR